MGIIFHISPSLKKKNVYCCKFPILDLFAMSCKRKHKCYGFIANLFLIKKKQEIQFSGSFNLTLFF